MGGNVQELASFCAPNFEYLVIKCHPFNFPRELSGIIATAVHNPPQADPKMLSKIFFGL